MSLAEERFEERIERKVLESFCQQLRIPRGTVKEIQVIFYKPNGQDLPLGGTIQLLDGRSFNIQGEYDGSWNLISGLSFRIH